MDMFEHISYAPTLTLLTKTNQSKSYSSNILGVYNKDDNLYYTKKEIELICKFFNKDKVKIKDNPKSNVFLYEAGNSKLIHVAAHSSYKYGDFWDAGILINDIENDCLTVAQIIADGNFKDTKLINLAACSTGLSSGVLDEFRNYSGVDISFLIKGAKSTISNFWKVNDFISFLYSACFYWGLSKGETIEYANKNAILYLRFNKFLDNDLNFELSTMLDTIYPDWCKELTNNKIKVNDITNWGCFKCSGIVWDKIL